VVTVQWDNVLLKKVIQATLSGSYIAGIYYPDKTSGMVEKWLS
jgi:hypothetical protein